jgi:hypothetical protein
VNLLIYTSFISLALLLLEIAVLFFFGWMQLLSGLISGCLLACFNLAAINYLVRRMTQGAAKKTKMLLPFIFVGKLLLVSAIIFLLIVHFHVNPIGLIAGITSVLTSLASAALITYFGSTLKGSSDG